MPNQFGIKNFGKFMGTEDFRGLGIPGTEWQFTFLKKLELVKSIKLVKYLRLFGV